MRADMLPIGLKVVGRTCLVVGETPEVWPRASTFFGAGAKVRVVSNNPPPDLLEASARGDVSLEQREFTEADLDDVWLAVLTDPDGALAERMARAAESRRVFFCAVDQPAHSSYSHLAIARNGPVIIAVSTGGRAPALARRLREELDRLLASVEIAPFVARLEALRASTASANRRKVLGNAVAGVHIDGKLVLPRTP